MNGAVLLRLVHDFHSGYLVLLTFVALGLLAGLLYRTGLLGIFLYCFQWLVGRIVRWGFRSWQRLVSWADWRQILTLAGALLLLGLTIGQLWPLVGLVLALLQLYLGTITCLACIFIDIERDEVARGYKALHRPLKGQALAENLVRYGHRVGVPLLIAATGGIIAGFALLNQALYETVGRSWYSLGHGEREPGYPDFLAYTLINLFRVVDLLNLANSYNKDALLITFVKQAKWPSSTLLALFQTFFSLVLLQQILSAIRKLKLLTQTIIDFWSPHEPIRERASGSLQQYGATAVWPLLYSLRSLEVVTAEQRAAIPAIIADIGQAATPTLIRALDDPDENVRYVAVASLGRLRVLDAIPELASLQKDRSDLVRQCLVEALGMIGIADGSKPRKVPRRRVVSFLRRWLLRRKGRPVQVKRHPGLHLPALTIGVLRAALADPIAGVRLQAARSLGHLGAAAGDAVSDLIGTLHDCDEAVRCQAAEALGLIGAEAERSVDALVQLLADLSPVLRTAVARALGAFKRKAEKAVPALVPLLHDHNETLRQAVAESIGAIGALQEDAVRLLGEGLASEDNMVRARTAEVAGAIGPPAAEVTPMLIEALDDSNDRVRAKAVQALGRIGEPATEAVPVLVRALRDDDNWVRALAAEALGEIGDSSGSAIPALVRSLRHTNPLVKANAAEALGKIGAAAASAIPALEQAAADTEDSVRCKAVFALGEISHLPPSTGEILHHALRDSHPEVRAAAATALGKQVEWKEASLAPLMRALDDANEQVQLAATQALARLADATPPVLDALSRLLEDDCVSVQAHAASALGRLGTQAAPAGSTLVHAAKTGEATVREQALRALALITPPEAASAFLAGLLDTRDDIRKIASAGLLKLADVPNEAVAVLIDSLRDPDVQVRANVARVLARLDSLPEEALPALIESTSHSDDGLRMNAALALRKAPAEAVQSVFASLLSDTNPRLRLLAAGSLLLGEPALTPAVAVVGEALADPAAHIRKAALDLIDSLGHRGTIFLPTLHERALFEIEPELSSWTELLIERLEQSNTESQVDPVQTTADR
jgi:HEAT repeat protein